ncbi:MAG: tetratricopeptide repeat protein [bacterium]
MSSTAAAVAPIQEPPSPLVSLLSWIGFSIVLLVCIGYVFFHAFLIDSVTVRLCREVDGPNAKPSEVLPVPLLEIAFDGYVWNNHAEHLGQNGQWQMRYTRLDNAPDGREIHWSSAFAWYLRGLGELHRHFSGDTLRNSIFRMSIWANPLLLIVALGLFSTLSARRFGPLCGSVLAIGMISTASFYEGFLPAYPDHHGITAFALLGMIFGIAWAGAGWVQKPDGTAFIVPKSLRQARQGMIFSAISAASALWISGFSAAFVAVGVGMGAVLTAWLFIKKATREGCEYHPELWRLWGIATALGSLGFYIAEYFPSHLGMRLEVNHPLYALSWLCGGWIIFETTRWIKDLQSGKAPFPWKNLLLPLGGCAILPAVILAFGPSVYIPGDKFMSGLWKNIAELLPLFARMQMGAITWKTAFGWFPVFLLAAIIISFLKNVSSATKGTLIFLCVPILSITAMQIYQVRWGMLNGPLYIALGALVIPQLWQLLPRTLPWRATGAAGLVGAIYLFSADTVNGMLMPFWAQYSSKQNMQVGFGQLMAMLHRDMAKVILQNAHGKPVVLLSSPNSSCLLATLGGFQTIGTLYWENVEGLKTAAQMLNAQSDAEALEMLQKHGVTHVSLMTWENFIGPYFQILYPNPIPGKSLDNSFGQRALFKKQIPRWARPIPYPKNFLTKALNQDVLMLEIVPNQTQEEAEFHLARYARISEGNPVAAEIMLKGILDRSPGSNAVRVELGDLYIDQNRIADAKKQYLLALEGATAEVRNQLAQRCSDILAKKGAKNEAEEILKASGASH